MSDEAQSSTNTAQEQRKPGKPFVKGDSRINRKGRPKHFDALRQLAQQLAHEVATAQGQPLERNGHTVTQIEALLLDLMHKNPERFIEIAFGKVPDEVKLSGDLQTTVKGYITVSPDDWDVQPVSVADQTVA